jgi:hypothetical protein
MVYDGYRKLSLHIELRKAGIGMGNQLGQLCMRLRVADAELSGVLGDDSA